jgi:hypothetical protein
MSDIIVTTPKTEMANSAREAQDCIQAGGGFYFRRFCVKPAGVKVGDRVFYVEDGYIRGYAVVCDIFYSNGMTCDTTGRKWPYGWYLKMRADSWKWIEPIAMNGFRGWRHMVKPERIPVIEVGGWLDPKPEVKGG